MLSIVGLDKQFWAETVTYVGHLISRLPLVALKDKTLLEVWSSKHANDYDTLYVFGSHYFLSLKESKLDQRAEKTLF